MIQIKNIVKNYLSGDNVVNALQDVSLNFRNSEFVSILGPSGCGKTTLLNIIGGLDKYTSGDIVINGVSTKEYGDKDWDKYRNHYIGFVFQSYNLISHLSVLENVELALSIAGLSKHEKKKRAIEALKEVGLENQLKKKPNQLSGGQMQRVAIARAIVNKPKIILADEPTGALDSETSTQVMEILKKISKDYLIIMVTHNEELAQKYSTRIISVLDGKVVSDTNPYNPTKKEIEKDIKQNQNEEQELNKKAKIKKQKNAMGFGTAFMLSLKNLWAKKGKTIIESFAGSIGIIGIALVLAVSAGFTNYINDMQSNTLGGYPLAVSMVAVNYDAIMGGGLSNMVGDKNTDDNSLSIYDPLASMGSMGHLNLFTDDFVNYINTYAQNDDSKSKSLQTLNSIRFDYNIQMPMLTKNKMGGQEIVTVVQNEVSASAISGSSSSTFYEILDNKNWILQNYDLIGNYSSSPNEVMLVVGKDNRMSLSVAQNLGLPIENSTNEDGKIVYNNIAYNNILEKVNYALLFNNAYYDKNNNYLPISLPNVENYEYTNPTITALYNQAEDFSVFETHKETGEVLKLKISGVLKAKEDAEIEILSEGLVYTKALRELYDLNSRNSEIVKRAQEIIAQNKLTDNTDNAYNIELPWTYSIAVSELDMIGNGVKFEYNKTSDMVAYIKAILNREVSYEQVYKMALQEVGVCEVPFAVYFYPTSFDAKQEIIDYISSWNKTEKGKENKIIYTDATEMLTSTMGQIIDIISYVLIAFAGISLIVSSVMIGIITYTSVIERTKEIGVLRSIGARKKDISRIFNTETILIGFFAGTLGVLVSFILTFPISSIIKSVAGGAITTSMAILEPIPALILILISTLLTAIAGTVPAKMASKKDPVLCLRSE